MAQVLRPPPKRRPSQIVTQASAGSSQPSSHPGSMQLPNIKECVALAHDSPERVPKVVIQPGIASTPKTEASADQAAAGLIETAVQHQSEKILSDTNAPSHPSDSNAASQPSSGDKAIQEAAAQQPESKDKSGTEEYVSPFEQAQEPAAAPEGQSPFANVS